MHLVVAASILVFDVGSNMKPGNPFLALKEKDEIAECSKKCIKIHRTSYVPVEGGSNME